MVYIGTGAGSKLRSREGMEQFDRQKFKAMLHYVIHRCPPDRLGRTKLNKVAFYADMISYLQRGRPITRETYVKQERGPVAYHMRSCLAELMREGAVSESRADYYGFAKYQYASLLEPDHSRLDDAERTLVEDMIEFVCMQNTAKSISELSHTEAWAAAQFGEEIPYFVATELLEGAEVDEGDLAWADEEIQHFANTRKYYEVRGQSLRALSDQLFPPDRRPKG